jgi:hypothetical protein
VSGSNLFLVDSVSSDAEFSHSVKVPEGFLGSALLVPHPAAGPLYVRLRDDPSVVNPATLIPAQLPASPVDLQRSAARQPALPTDASTNSEPNATPRAGDGEAQKIPLPAAPLPSPTAQAKD